MRYERTRNHLWDVLCQLRPEHDSPTRLGWGREIEEHESVAVDA
jgi:hypothetical protein